MDIDEVDVLTEEQKKKLKEHWITTVEELVSLYQIEKVRDNLKELLEVDDNELEEIINQMIPFLPRGILQTIQKPVEKKPLGYIIPEELKKKWGLDSGGE